MIDEYGVPAENPCDAISFTDYYNRSLLLDHQLARITRELDLDIYLMKLIDGTESA